MTDTNEQDIIQLSKELYSNTIDRELFEWAKSLDPEKQDFFWAYYYLRMKQEADQKILRLIEQMVKDEVEEDASYLSATPFKDAETAISAHSWFRSDRFVSGKRVIQDD